MNENENEKVERLIAQMSLKHPSGKLDERITELMATGPPDDIEPARNLQRSNNWNSTILASAVALLIGVVLGYVVSAQQRANSADSVGVNPSTDGNPSGLPLHGDGQFASRSQIPPTLTDLPESRTRIVDHRLISMPDGEVRRAYQTVTPRQFLFFDKKEKTFRDIEIALPRIVVTNPRGI